VKRREEVNNPELFKGTAFYYSRYRRGYPPEAIEVLVRGFDLNSSTRVLDLGCGTGQIAIPLAKRGIPVIAVDPDVEMFAEGLRAEQATGIAGIAWISTSYASPAQLGPRLDEFESALRTRLLQLNPSGVFDGETTTELLIATR